ncbi:MAG: hypothetical protein PHO23_03435 [Candidatus Pacebacteria bacterium]|nr:hypothetical protein [Candidatus Paceibacterota bacterium]
MKLKSLFNLIITIVAISLLVVILVKTNNTHIMIKDEIAKLQLSKEKPSIVLKNLKENDFITSPLVIKGEAKGT